MERELEVGQHLVFIDAERKERDALLLCIHGDPKGGTQEVVKGDDGEPLRDPKKPGYVQMHTVPGTEGSYWPCINIVVVCDNPEAQDQYGRQTTKEHTSVVHWTHSSANGYCWRFADEEMTGEAAPPIS